MALYNSPGKASRASLIKLTIERNRVVERKKKSRKKGTSVKPLRVAGAESTSTIYIYIESKKEQSRDPLYIYIVYTCRYIYLYT